jgi:hypothetical protein
MNKLRMKIRVYRRIRMFILDESSTGFLLRDAIRNCLKEMKK